MSTFHDQEISVEDSQPRSALHAWHGPTHYRIAQGDDDITIEFERYPAGPIEIGDLVIATESGKQERTFTLPLSHPLALRWMLKINPPRRVYVDMWLQQIGSAGHDTIKEFAGFVVGMVPSSSGGTAMFTARSRLGMAYERTVPNVVFERNCPHRLYDSMCKVPKSGVNQLNTTGVQSGTVVTLASIGGKPNHWAQFGELLHVASGETRPIQDQIGTAVTIKYPIPTMEAHDAVIVWRGCKHTVRDCRDSFANVMNMGGQPHLIKKSPFSWVNIRALFSDDWDY